MPLWRADSGAFVWEGAGVVLEGVADGAREVLTLRLRAAGEGPPDGEVSAPPVTSDAPEPRLPGTSSSPQRHWPVGTVRFPVYQVVPLDAGMPAAVRRAIADAFDRAGSLDRVYAAAPAPAGDRHTLLRTAGRSPRSLP